MKPHPRIRKTIKWGGAVVTVLLVVVWIGSGWKWWHTGSVFRSSLVAVAGGRFVIAAAREPLNTHDAMLDFNTICLDALLSTQRPPAHLVSGFAWWRGSSSIALAVPIWSVAAVAGAATLVLHRRDSMGRRRARLNLCPKCGYDRAGIVGGAGDAKCPECGVMPRNE